MIAANAPVPRNRVDFGRHFIPEVLTPLFFTPVYRELEACHRRRYNQLQALYFNEQIVFLERLIDQAIMPALLRAAWPGDLRGKLQNLWDDERRHSEMFRRLNRTCAPELYAGRDSCFIRVPRPWMRLLHWTARHPRAFPLYLWLMLLMEERSLYYSGQYLRAKETLEPNFVAVYRAHLLDEASHVRWDQELIDRWWPTLPRAVRTFNARLLAWMLSEFFSAPRRGQLSVVRRLVHECPELQPRLPEIERQLLALGSDERYHFSIYSRDITPRCFAHFDEWPELRALERVMPGYRSLGSQTA